MPVKHPDPFNGLEDVAFWDKVRVRLKKKAWHDKKQKRWGIDPSKIRKRYMTPFEKHGIAHLSPSAVNMFTGSPSAWIAKSLLGYRFSAGPAALRGQAVEAAIESYLLHGSPPDECIELACKHYDRQSTMNNFGQSAIVERELLANYVVNTIDAFIELETNYPIGKIQAPAMGARQWEVHIPCRFGDHPNDKVDVMGFLDFMYADEANKNTIIDLKTTARIPSGWQPAHALQAAFYKRAHGGNPDVYFVYTSPKQTGKPNAFNILKLDDETYNAELTRLKKTITRMAKLLSLSDDPIEIAEAVPHDPTTFYWGGEKHLDDLIEDWKTANEATKKES